MEAKRKIDPVMVAVLSRRFLAICDEIGRTMLRTSRSSIFSEARDFVTAIFDKDNRLVAQRDYIAILAGGLPLAMEEITRVFKGDIHEGDIFIHNDPFAGNNHPPDVNIVKPVFYQGKLRFWSVAKGHQADVAGGGICGYNPTSTDIWGDGIIIPANKLYDRGKLNEGFWKMILRNIKMPSIVEGDLQCMIGAATIGERSLLGVLEKYGAETTETAAQHVDVELFREFLEVRIRRLTRNDMDAVAWADCFA